MLSSDILESQFGPTRLAVLYQDTEHRLIQTIVEDTGQILELSLVTFDSENVLTFPEVHQAIVDGISIGKAYRSAGIPFNRNVNSVDRVSLASAFQPYIETLDQATIIDVDIYVGDTMTHYCHITEIYSSVVSWPHSVHTTNPIVGAKLNDVIKILHKVTRDS